MPTDVLPGIPSVHVPGGRAGRNPGDRVEVPAGVGRGYAIVLSPNALPAEATPARRRSQEAPGRPDGWTA